MFCTKCGNQLLDDSKFCIECGNPVSASDPAGAPGFAAEQSYQSTYNAGQPTYNTGQPTYNAGQPTYDPRPPINYTGQPAYSAGPPVYAPARASAKSIAVSIIVPVLSMILITVILAFIIFLVVDSQPGDPVRAMLGSSATEAEIRQYNLENGLDDPLMTRFTRVLTGDFGVSMMTKRSVNEEIGNRLPYTIKLLLISLVVTLVFALPAGIFSAVMHNKFLDVFCSILSVLCKAVPFFMIGLQLIYWFSVEARLLPVSGVTTWAGYVLPVITLGFLYFGFAVQTIRATALRALNSNSGGIFLFLLNSEPYKDASGQDTILPTIARSGIQLGWMTAGVILIEMIFAIPGVGGLLFTALSSRDIPVILGSIMTLFFCSIITALVFGILISAVIYAVARTIAKGRQRI